MSVIVGMTWITIYHYGPNVTFITRIGKRFSWPLQGPHGLATLKANSDNSILTRFSIIIICKFWFPSDSNAWHQGRHRKKGLIFLRVSYLPRLTVIRLNSLNFVQGGVGIVFFHVAILYWKESAKSMQY